MTDKTYKVKPLAWERDPYTFEYTEETGITEMHEACVLHGHYEVFTNGVIWKWSFFGEEGRQFVTPCDSLKQGKQRCQEHWESELGIGRYLEAIATHTTETPL